MIRAGSFPPHCYGVIARCHQKPAQWAPISHFSIGCTMAALDEPQSLFVRYAGFSLSISRRCQMKRNTLQKLENFMRHTLKTKLRNDLVALRITKEADAECCMFFHLRRTVPSRGPWKVLARKHSRRTGHYIDLLVFKRRRPRLAVEIKWNKKQMSGKDRQSLDFALMKLKVNKAYFVSVGPNLSNYREIQKKDFEKSRLHEIPIDLGFRNRSRVKQWRVERSLYGKLMSTGIARIKNNS
jgi:hypothetical protein